MPAIGKNLIRQPDENDSKKTELLLYPPRRRGQNGRNGRWPKTAVACYGGFPFGTADVPKRRPRRVLLPVLGEAWSENEIMVVLGGKRRLFLCTG